jgi:hypothetical protein
MEQNFADRLYQQYETYKEKTLTQRRFGVEAILPLIKRFSAFANVELIGQSVEQRPIQLISFGHGPVKILAWSQMHGDEPTATMALMDIFNFFADDQDFQQEKNLLLAQCTFYIVPMLNPDGAARFTRRNALGVDMNRDALALVSPESRLLKQLQNVLQPQFAFNLHDQSHRYSLGEACEQAAVTFLATAYNQAREVNPVRSAAMQVIVGMNKTLQKYLPNKIGRFSDEFEPRAFGDNIQAWGSSLVLFESGGMLGDPEKQEIRKANFVGLLSAFYAIASKQYLQENIDEYSEIPENEKNLVDVLLKNVTIKHDNGFEYVADIALNMVYKPEDAAQLLEDYWIEDLGDLHLLKGLQTLDAAGLIFKTTQDIAIGEAPAFELWQGTICKVKASKNNIEIN